MYSALHIMGLTMKNQYAWTYHSYMVANNLDGFGTYSVQSECDE